MAKCLREEHVRARLRLAARLAGGQLALSKRWRVNRAYLAGMIAGTERPNAKVLRRLKLRRLVVYAPI